MPHIHLVTSSNLFEIVDVPEILEALVLELRSYDAIDGKSVKAYHTLHNTWRTGDGAPSGFAHCEVRLRSGKPLELRQRIARGIHAKLCALLATSIRDGEAAVTVELREMASDTYIE